MSAYPSLPSCWSTDDAACCLNQAPNGWIFGDANCCEEDTTCGCGEIQITAAPEFDPVPGGYALPLFVSLSSETPDAVIYYTVDGSTPDTSSAIFDPLDPIILTDPATIKAIAIAPGLGQSPVSVGVYTQLVVATPVITPPTGNFSGTQLVTITDATPGADVYYTTDGSTPDGTDTLYTVPFTISATTTVKAKGFLAGSAASSVASETYTKVTLTVANPTFLPTSGTFTTDPLTVSISTITALADIYYTLDGSAPTILSTLYTGPFNISDTTTIKAFAVRAGYTDSGVVTKVYTFTPVTTQLFWFGGSDNDSITDFSEWHVANPVGFDNSGVIASPVSNYHANFTGAMLNAGAWPYFCMMDDMPAPLAPLDGGFRNTGGVFLNTSDFASPATGYPAFSDTDSNGWPCIIAVNPDDGLVWREYRLVNQPFAAITLQVYQV